MFRRLTITDGTRVLIFSAFAYLLAYMFLFSYLNHFDISSLAITITIPNLIVSLAALGISLFMLDQAAELWRELEPALRGKDPAVRLLRENIRMTFAISVFLAFFYGFTGKFVWPLYIITGLLDFAFPLLNALIYIPLKKKTFKEGLAQVYKNRDKNRSNKNRMPSYTHSMGVYVAAAFLLISVASLSGKVFAMRSTDFFIVGESKNIKELLIQKNDNELVIKRFNTRTHKFESGFQLKNYEHSLNLKARYNIKQGQ